MLPLIPALLLIVLQGPAGAERMALNGRLPDALRSLTASTRTSADQALQSEALDRETLASLLHGAGSYELTQLLAKVLEIVCEADVQPAPSEPVTPISSPDVTERPAELGAQRSGFSRSARTRDGPILS